MANKFRVVQGLKFDQIEKAPGWDWVVFYLGADDREILSMSVFGQMTSEKAIEEARFSLEAGSGNSDYEILGWSARISQSRNSYQDEMLTSRSPERHRPSREGPIKSRQMILSG